MFSRNEPCRCGSGTKYQRDTGSEVGKLII
ncbi:SEC-C metal-binding domain-containing protein [Acidovorax radicis]|nr:SEC-C domain-containing protein [Acidovorax radicis]